MCIDLTFCVSLFSQPKLQRFGAHSFTPDLLNEMMKSTGATELIKNVYFVAFMVFAVTMSTPLTPELKPTLVDGEWVELPAVVRGMPESPR